MGKNLDKIVNAWPFVDVDKAFAQVLDVIKAAPPGMALTLQEVAAAIKEDEQAVRVVIDWLEWQEKIEAVITIKPFPAKRYKFRAMN